MVYNKLIYIKANILFRIMLLPFVCITTIDNKINSGVLPKYQVKDCVQNLRIDET